MNKKILAKKPAAKKNNTKKNVVRSNMVNNKKRVIKEQNNTNKSANNQVYSVILLGIAVLVIAMLFISGSNIWLFFHNVLFGFFSKGAYFLPIILIYIAYVYENNKSLDNSKGILGKSLVLFLLVCTMIQIIFGSSRLSEQGLIDFFISVYNEGVNKDGGGLISAIIAWPLVSLLGFGGAIALLIVSILILVMIILKITVKDLFKAAYAPAKKIENICSEKYPNKPRMTNIDIPLRDFPEHPVESNKQNFYVNKKLDKINKDIVDKDNSDNKKKHDKIKFIELDEINNKNITKEAKLNDSDDLNESVFEEVGDFSGYQEKMSLEDEKINDEKINDKKMDIKENITITSNKEQDIDEEIDDEENNIKNKDQLFDDINEILQKKIKENKRNDQMLNDKNEYKENNDSNIFKANVNELKNKVNFQNLPSYIFPDVNLLKNTPKQDDSYNSEELKNTAQILVDTLKSFGVTTKLLDFSKGPTVTRYELKPAAGVKISKITGLADDIALNLATAGVRIEAPIPNKSAVGIEVPNKTVSIVGIKEIVDSPQFKNSNSNLSVALGKDISGNVTVADIAKMPHVLIAGSTGSGKSVCINSIIISLIYKSSPENVRLLMVDPKVVELGVYNEIPHLLIPVVTDPKKAAGALNWAVSEMLKRYNIFAETGVRDLKGYNRLTKQREDLNPLPNIVIIIDELADLMMVAPNEIEDSICRLAQMARAAGMHLIIATQRPSVDVVTGIIKANIPSRIAFAVSSQVDSRTIIDSAGAEKLLGRGDMLFFPMGYSKPVRVQGCFVSDKEVERVVQFIKSSYKAQYDDEISQEIDRLAVVEKGNKGSSSASDQNEDELLSSAIECAIDNGEVSTSFLQRKLKLGYSRAARLIDEMEDRGIIGPKEGSKPRQTLISRQQWIEMNLNNSEK